MRVVGAGPIGLAAALELARLGWRVRIVDESPTRSQHFPSGRNAADGDPALVSCGMAS